MTPYVHVLRPRYAEIDQQGVVFNGHWLTYFDEACTRFLGVIGGAPPAQLFLTFDMMVVRAVLDWQGPARFDDEVAIAVVVSRMGSASFELTYSATVDGAPVCSGTITYVSVVPGSARSTPVPEPLRTALHARLA